MVHSSQFHIDFSTKMIDPLPKSKAIKSSVTIKTSVCLLLKFAYIFEISSTEHFYVLIS